VIRVLIVDDQALVREGFRMILAAEQDIDVIAEASDGMQALQFARELAPDVVLMDIRMPELDGLEAARRLLARDGARPRVVMLTTFDQDEYIYDALRNGASGFLLKDATRSQLLHAVRTVAAGEEMLAPAITRRLIERFTARPPHGAGLPPQLSELSDRELEILRLMARGLSNAEIAAELVVSGSTVKTHVAHILQKLRLRDRVHAVVLAYDTGLMQSAAES
jgi:DNA-binding NarL/FixJ family response regulator